MTVCDHTCCRKSWLNYLLKQFANVCKLLFFNFMIFIEIAIVACTGTFLPEARWTLTHNFHLSSGACANIKGQGNFGWTILLALESACVCRGVLSCVLLVVQKWITNILYVFFNFPWHIDFSLSESLVSVKWTNINNGWLVLYRCAFKISKIFLPIILLW